MSGVAERGKNKGISRDILQQPTNAARHSRNSDGGCCDACNSDRQKQEEQGKNTGTRSMRGENTDMENNSNNNKKGTSRRLAGEFAVDVPVDHVKT